MCRARTGWRGWSRVPGKDEPNDNLQHEQRSAGQAHRGIAAAQVLAAASGDVLKVQLLLSCWDGEGVGQDLHTIAVASHPVCPVSAFPQCQSRVGSAESQAGSSRMGKQAGANSSAQLPLALY